MDQPQAARKWQHRFAAQGALSLLDRSSRPRRSPCQTDADKIKRTVALWHKQQLTYAQIAKRMSLSRNTVVRACQAAGEILHLDTKKLARFAQPSERTVDTPCAGVQGAYGH